MYARLYAKAGQLAGKSYDIVTEAVIGHGRECNLLIKSGILSAKHARIFFDQKKGSYFLEDFKTHNGTLLDGKPVQGKVKLEKKHVIIFANTFTFIFQLEHGQAADPLPLPPRDLPPEPELPPPRRKQSEPLGDFSLSKVMEAAAPPAPARQAPAPPLAPPPPFAAPAPPPPPPAPPAPQVRKPDPDDNPFGDIEPPVKQHTVFDDGFESAPPGEGAEKEPEFIGDLLIPEPVPHSRDAAPTMLIDESQLEDLLNAPPRFILEFKNVRGEKHTVDLKEGENGVGRLAGSDVAVDDASISRSHATITVRKGKVTLRDLESKNGTFVGDKKITGDAEVEPDAPIRFGLVKATIVRKPEKSA